MKNQTRRKILLVDDDMSLLVTLSDFLSFEGYEVITADCGEQGLERLKTITPDLIILDMSMPGMGGVGFLKEITGTDGKPQHPVLVLTARANMAEFFAEMEVDGFIAKPCDPSDLLKEVGRIVFLRSGADAAAVPGVALKAGKVLLAEDDLKNNQVIAAAFSDSGYDISTVDKGPEVLQKAITDQPDVIVLKLVLSGMNGDAIAALLKDMPNTTGIPLVLYDDSEAMLSEDKYLEGGTGIRKIVRNNDPKALLAAVGEILS